MENVNLNNTTYTNVSKDKNSVWYDIEKNINTEPVKDGNDKMKKALIGLGVAGAVIATGIGIYKGVIKPKKAMEQITDITKDGIGKLLKENDKLTGKFQKVMDDGSKVVVEYADGVLQKSTKTASDGAEIFQKIYSKADNGDLLVNGKNITEIANKAKQHQDDFSKLMQKADVGLEELEKFDRKNLSKKQIDDLDVKINNKKQAIEIEKQKAKEAEELAKKQAEEAKVLAEKKAKETEELAKKQAAEAEAKAKAEAEAKAKIEAEAKAKAEAETKAEVQDIKTAPKQVKSQKLFDEYNAKAKEIIEKNKGNMKAVQAEEFKLNMDFAQRYVDENIDELDSLLLDEKGRISFYLDGQRQKVTFEELIQPYEGTLGDIYHGTTLEAKASILKNGFDTSIRPKHGFLDGVGGTYFSLSNNGNYGDGIIKAKFNGKVALANTEILNNIKTDTNNKMFTLDRLLKKQGFEKYSDVDEAIMLKYLQKKITDMGYQGILGTNFSVTANCRYFAALDPSLIEIIS